MNKKIIATFCLFFLGCVSAFSQASTKVGLAEYMDCSGTWFPSQSIRIGGTCAPFANATNGTPIRIEYRVRNYDAANSATNIQVVKDLQAFANQNAAVITGIDSFTGSGPLTLNASFNGTTDQNVFTGAGTLAPNQEQTVVIIFRIWLVSTGINTTSPSAPSFTDQSTVTGLLNGAPFSDLSQTGVIADANGDGDPGNDGIISGPIRIDQHSIPYQTKYSGPTQVTPNADGSFTVTWLLRGGISGNAYAYNVQMVEDLRAMLPAPATYTINSITAAGNYAGRISPTFNGDTDKNLLLPNTTVPPGGGGDINFSIRVHPNGIGPWVYNQVTLSSETRFSDGVSWSRTTTSTQSTSYTSYPAGPSTNHAPFLLADPIGVGYALNTQSITPTASGYEVVFRVVARNYGSSTASSVWASLPVNNLQHLRYPSEDIHFVSGNVVSGPVTLNPNYTGLQATYGGNYYTFSPQGTDLPTELFNGATFNPGEAATIDLTFAFNNLHDCFNLQTKVIGQSTVGGISVQDFSVSGINPDPDGNGRPDNNTGGTLVAFPCTSNQITDARLYKGVYGGATYPTAPTYRQGDQFGYYLQVPIVAGWRGLNQQFVITDSVPTGLDIISAQILQGSCTTPSISGQNVSTTCTVTDTTMVNDYAGGNSYVTVGGTTLFMRIMVRVGAATVPGIYLNSGELTTLGNTISSVDGSPTGSTPSVIVNTTPVRPTQIRVVEVLRVTKTIVPVGSATPTGTYNINITGANVHTQNASNTIIDDTLNNTMTYVAESIRLNGTPMTDTEDGDLCYYRSAEKRVHCNLGLGATSASGGTLNSGASAVVTFQVTGNLPSNGGTLTNSASASAIGAYNVGSASYTIVPAPNITLLKTCTNPANCTTATQRPTTELTFSIGFTNTGIADASNIVIVDSVPVNTDFKTGTASSTAGFAHIIEYSSDYSATSPGVATWTYVPVSAGGGAPLGYDRNVKALRLRQTGGTLSSSQTGTLQFIVIIR